MSSKVTSSGLRKTKSIHVTREQKSILKNAFMFIPYPDHYPDSLSKLSDDTGLDQEAIKKWFRNRRKKVGSKNGDNEDQEEIKIQKDEVDKSLDADEASENVAQNSNTNETEAVNEDLPAENVSNDLVNEKLASENVEGSSDDAKEELASGNAQVSNDDIANVQLATEVKNSTDVIESVVIPEQYEDMSSNMEVSSESTIDKTIELDDTVEETKDAKTSGDSSVIIVNHLPELAVEAEGEDMVHETTSDQLDPDPAVDPKQEETKPIAVDGQEELSTEEKAVQYDVLKSEFSALQTKFESLAKVLGSHGIDVGDESATAQPTTSQPPMPDDSPSETPSYSPSSRPVQQKVVYPPGPTAEQSIKPEEFVGPKQEPQPYGWPNQDFNSQMHNQPWLQHQQYPPLYPNGYSAPYPYPAQNYNLPYPPPHYPFHNQPLVEVQNPSVPPQLKDSSLSSPANEASYPTRPDATPKQKTKATKKRTTKNQSRVSPYLREGLLNIQNSVDEIGAHPVQSFQGVIGAAKKSFLGPSKLKSKSNPKVTDFSSVQPPLTLPSPPSAVAGPAIRSLPVQPGGRKPRRKALPLKPKVSEVQTLYPPIAMAGPSTQSMPPQPGKPRRNTLQPKTKLGAHPKPFPKVAPAPVTQVQQYEQSLKASNPFRQTKALVSRRNSMPAKTRREPEIQTLYPPIIHESRRQDVEFLRGVNQKTIQKTQDVQRSLQMGGVSLKKVPGPSFPMINNTSISIKKVYNPLTDPNKAQELKKVMAMTNLSVSLSRK